MIDLKKIFCLTLMVLLTAAAVAQDPLRFEKEVNEMLATDATVKKENLILFTGSSSIRMWADLKDYFPDKNVLNRGFGGSETTDLIYYAGKLIVPYQPRQIFIYEGDNDLNSGKSPEEILASTEDLLRLIRKELPKKTPVYFITPKPSLARWEMKDKYLKYRQMLKAWCSKNKNVTCVDMWAALTDQNGDVLKDIFIEDGLHLNKQGYQIWSAMISKYVK